MATDAELRDRAVAELKLTTAGWRKSNGQPNYPSGEPPLTTHWGKAMALLAQIDVAPPPPPPPPPPTALGLDFPAKFHIWGGNEGSKATQVDFLVCAHPKNADPNAARPSNPKLIAACHPGWDADDWHKSHAITYGGALSQFPGANDTLTPNPQGQIRAFASSDKGCMQTDGLQGFAIDNPATQEFFKRLFFYEWKLQRSASRGYNGIWSDNFFPGNTLGAGWAYGSCGASISASAWDAGYVTIIDYLKQNIPGVLIGGNVLYRTTNQTLRQKTDMAMRESLEVMIGQGTDSLWKDIQEAQAWFAAGGTKIMAVNHKIASSDQNGMRFGWALACMYGGAYNAYDGNHANTYWPSGVTRGYLGKPTGPPQRSGNVFTRQFEHGKVTADVGAKTGTFA